MGAREKRQLNLFQAEAPAPAAHDESEIVRRELQRLLWIMRTAERMPWSEIKTARQERLFGELAPTLPEGEELMAAFHAELKRLRAA